MSFPELLLQMNTLVRLTQQPTLQFADQTGCEEVNSSVPPSPQIRLLRENILYDQLMKLRYWHPTFSRVDIDTSFHLPAPLRQ